MDYHQLANFIGDGLPGEGVWLHSAPTEERTTEDGNETTSSQYPLAEGVAIRVFRRDDVQTEVQAEVQTAVINDIEDLQG